jgi:hypothetical protein
MIGKVRAQSAAWEGRRRLRQASAPRCTRRGRWAFSCENRNLHALAVFKTVP